MYKIQIQVFFFFFGGGGGLLSICTYFEVMTSDEMAYMYCLLWDIIRQINCKHII